MSESEKEEVDRLKLIIVLGFPNSGKTTLINRLYADLTHRSDWDIDSPQRWRSATCTIKKKQIDIYFGLDGDDEECVAKNVDRIANKRYDIAIIPLSRSVMNYGTQAIPYVWQKWIDRSIYNFSMAKPSKVFPDHERYYVHTLIPQLCMIPKYSGQICTQFGSLSKMCDKLSDVTGNHIKQLLQIIVQ